MSGRGRPPDADDKREDVSIDIDTARQADQAPDRGVLCASCAGSSQDARGDQQQQQQQPQQPQQQPQPQQQQQPWLPLAVVAAADHVVAAADHVKLTLASTLRGSSNGNAGEQQQQQQDGEPGNTGLRECRICLSAEDQHDIVTPCSCTGTVATVHLECLKAWVAERCSLTCELCHKQYIDDLRAQLQPLVDAGRRRGRGRRGSGGGLGSRPGSATVLVIEGLDGAEDARPRPQVSWTRFWIHLGILVMLLVAVLYLALFVNVGAESNFWLMFLWRAITVILPLFLIIRCVAALYAWRQQRMVASSRAAAAAAAAAAPP